MAGRTRTRRVSQADVARAAQVSPAIVSSVVNDRSYGAIRISDATRQRVWAAVHDLGYVPNLAARSLARGSNQLIAVFTYQPVFPYDRRDFYHDFLTGVEEAAEQAGYNLLMVTGARTPDGERSVYAGGVNNLQLADGAVLLGSGEKTEELERLSAEDFPFVYIGQRRPPGVPLSYVGAGYRSGTAAVVAALVEQGHRRIGYVQVAGEGEPVPARRPGFDDGCTAAGLGSQDHPRFTIDAGAVDDGVTALDGVDRLLAVVAERGIGALLVENAEQASRIVGAARAGGVAVPGGLSVVSLGVGTEPADGATIGRLAIPRRAMGRRAVECLLELLGPDVDADAPLRVTLDCGFEPAGTVGPAV